ncbi:PREDICTED: F-box/kelch-repeat protein SKIP6-like [Camelina sativa]|uniref:F-box/kelch-repeat protein SKIP6-like n=1 Tax=Camelina sativa TaxID=90675 RepID=A0ABM0TCE4_CAMSA|nr:PREDICTED: F-box/kelch-repeat protein SKIP6-like [Camelina sativa]
MKGRSAICGLELNNETELCGLWWVPDDVVVDCLTLLSRLDLVALSMVSKRYRCVAKSHDLRILRSRSGCLHPYMYVYMHMYPDPSPRWLVLHPVQRRLKRLNMDYSYPAPVAGSCFVQTAWGIFIIGGLIDGKPTSEVTFFDCTDHTVRRVNPMKMARSGASASLIDNKKIYVFGGCWDAADSSKWAEVYDLETGIWEFLPVSTPKMPLKIQQSVVTDDSKHVYAVDEDGQIFKFSTSECVFEAETEAAADADYGNDWLLAHPALFCRGTGGRILWRIPFKSTWREVKGLEELQQQHSGFDIIKFCFSRRRGRMAIFWEARPQGPDDQILELWYAEFSIAPRVEGQVLQVVANIEWSGAVLSSDSSCTDPFNLLYAVSLYV